jgi:hypothetical protein
LSSTPEKLFKLLAAFPALPVWRLNFFRMPDEYKPFDEARLLEQTLTKPEIDRAADALRALQPGLLY